MDYYYDRYRDPSYEGSILYDDLDYDNPIYIYFEEQGEKPYLWHGSIDYALCHSHTFIKLIFKEKSQLIKCKVLREFLAYNICFFCGRFDLR